MCRLALGLCALCLPASASAVVWERQAERLQKVSAALLDAAPVGEPIAGALALSLGVNVSFLPSVDPTVGGKKEKVPSAPVHTVPTITRSTRAWGSGDFGLGTSLWAGYLPSGAEALFGIDAKLSQAVFGGQITPTYEGLGWGFFLPIGVQRSSAEMVGAITAKGANDKFKSETTLIFIAPGIQIPALGLWANVLLADRRNVSQFTIPADDTDFRLRDSLGDADWPILTQVTIGYRPWPWLQVTASEQWTPARLLMPRFGVSYTYDFIPDPLPSYSPEPTPPLEPLPTPEPMPSPSRVLRPFRLQSQSRKCQRLSPSICRPSICRPDRPKKMQGATDETCAVSRFYFPCGMPVG